MMMMMMIRIRSVQLYKDVVWFIQTLTRILGPTFEHSGSAEIELPVSRDQAKAFTLSRLTNSF